MGKQDEHVEPVRAAADTLREKNGLAYGVAKLELGEGLDTQHVEYFRGKDLVRYIKEYPGKLDGALRDRAGRTAEESAAELVRTFLGRGLLYATERKYKRPKPGRTRLVKWPRTLLLVRDQQWDESAFYAWRYDRPTSVWYHVAAVAVPVLVILGCLFPLAPWWARMALVYFLMAVLAVLLGCISLRYMLFAAVWVASGAAFWVFPNMMSDQVSLFEAFTPVVSFKKPKRMTEQWQARLVSALMLGGIVWVLASHTPDMAHLKSDVAKAHDSLSEYLGSIYAKDKSYLGGSTDAAGSHSSKAGGAGGNAAGGSKGSRQQRHQDL